MDIKRWVSESTSAVTSVVEVKRYFDNWKKSGNGLIGDPSFHLILEGECWLQLDGFEKKIHLVTDDIVFIFRKKPVYFYTTPNGTSKMMGEILLKKTDTVFDGNTSMLIGVMLARNETTKLLFSLMPDFIILRSEEKVNNSIRLLFELINKEYDIHIPPCDITIFKLTEVILLYLVEYVMSIHPIDLNIIRATRLPQMTTLFLAILKSPGWEWGVENMAEKAGMSRSTFIRRVNTLCGGYTPNEILTRLRISSALNILRYGKSAEVVAGMVGYDTPAGFSRAFTRIMGEAPGSWCQRMLHNN